MGIIPHPPSRKQLNESSNFTLLYSTGTENKNKTNQKNRNISKTNSKKEKEIHKNCIGK